MLVLSRKVGERILIGDNISVTIVRVAQGTVRIGVEAPHELPIVREELEPKSQGGASGDLDKPASRVSRAMVESYNACPNGEYNQLQAKIDHRGIYC